MDRLLQNMVHLANATLPAKIVGLTDRGTLDLGKRADIVLFDENLQITRTIVGGEDSLPDVIAAGFQCR